MRAAAPLRDEIERARTTERWTCRDATSTADVRAEKAWKIDPVVASNLP